MRIIIFFPLILISQLYSQTKLIELTGKVLNKSTSETVSNCNVVVENTSEGAITDASGIFNLLLPEGNYKIRLSHVGFETHEIDILLEHKTNIEIKLTPALILNDEVNIIGKVKYSSVETQILTTDEIKKMPSFNKDVLQSISIMPGVTANNELSNSYNVRGGSFNENLIYLNGYEIYRPYFLKNGMQENQSIANPDLVKNISFHSGGFDASYGDKMSSALEIDYSSEFDNKIKGTAHANLLYAGLAISNKYKNLNWAIAGRYTYPTLLLKSQQVEGSYRPLYWDAQALINYSFSPTERLELLIISASNKFDLTPQNWRGDFLLGQWDVRSVSGNYKGNKNYSFQTNLVGLKYVNMLNEDISLVVSASSYFMKEKENNNLITDYYYSPDGYNPDADKEYLKTTYETADNLLDLKTYEVKSEVNYKKGAHNISFGAQFKKTGLTGIINENYYESGAQASQVIPLMNKSDENYSLNTASVFVQDKILLGELFQLTTGVRTLYYYYSKETLVSPRAGIVWYPSPVHTIKFMYGYYYQPPFFQELKNTNGKTIKSQRSVHYILGWDYQFKETVKLLAEVYYKKLNNLIPFNLDEVKLEYITDKITDGYAYGVDVQVQGEFVKGAQSWVGYSYLNTREKANGTYKRRLLDQTHTLQLFLQDRFPKHPNWQAHVRLLVGSGYLFYPRIITTDANGQKQLTYSFDYRYAYSPYFRTDMGLTTELKIGENQSITITADVLNVFDKQNNAGYTWVKAFKDSEKAVPIMQVISGRFFNVGLEMNF